MSWLARTVGNAAGIGTAMPVSRTRARRGGSGRAIGDSSIPASLRTAAVALVATVLAGALLAGTALAHEFYLQPSSYKVIPGQPIAITLGVGHAFDGAPLPYTASHVAKFVAESPTGTRRSIEGIEGAHPAGIAQLPHGDWSLLYAGKPWIQVLSREALEVHFNEVGRPDLLKAAPKHEVRERVYRCARALVGPAVREKSIDWSAQRKAGCDFDLVPVAQSPTKLHMALLRNGKPVSGWRITISTPGQESAHSNGGMTHGHRHTVAKTTDARGAFSVDLTGTSGAWLVTAVQVEPTEEGDADAQAGAEYRSFWASLAFHVGPQD